MGCLTLMGRARVFQYLALIPPPCRLCHMCFNRVDLLGRQQSILYFPDRGVEVRARVI